MGATSPGMVYQGFKELFNDYAILACDGVWDVLSPNDVIEIARTEIDPQKGAQKIKERALDYGSTDNISVIVLALMDYTKTIKFHAMKIATAVDYAI